MLRRLSRNWWPCCRSLPTMGRLPPLSVRSMAVFRYLTYLVSPRPSTVRLIALLAIVLVRVLGALVLAVAGLLVGALTCTVPGPVAAARDAESGGSGVHTPSTRV